MDRLGGALGSIAKNTIPFRARCSMVPAGQGCAAARDPRAMARLCGPTWESPAFIVTPQDPSRAVQSQCRLPPPHPEATASGDLVARITTTTQSSLKLSFLT